jgi:hypothetical protein
MEVRGWKLQNPRDDNFMTNFVETYKLWGTHIYNPQKNPPKKKTIVYQID